MECLMESKNYSPLLRYWDLLRPYKTNKSKKHYFID